MSNKVLVKFNRPWAAYSRNDIAGFDEKTAGALIDSKIAGAYDPETDGAAPAEDKPAGAKGGEKGTGDDSNPPAKKDGEKASGGKEAAKQGKDGAAPAADKPAGDK